MLVPSILHPLRVVTADLDLESTVAVCGGVRFVAVTAPSRLLTAVGVVSLGTLAAGGVALAALLAAVTWLVALGAPPRSRYPGGHRYGEVAAEEPLGESTAAEEQPNGGVGAVPCSGSEALHAAHALRSQLLQELLVGHAVEGVAADAAFNGVQTVGDGGSDWFPHKGGLTQ